MDTKTLEKFAQNARRELHKQVHARLTRVLQTDSVEIREKAKVVTELQKQIAATSRDAVVEQVAYTWFNRFCALRYMDANRYTRIGVVSAAPGATQPELLQEAKQGHIDADLPVDKQRVFDLLGGRVPSSDPQQEAYRLLLVAACNQWHGAMPFLFEKIDDYTELLMPDDLLSANSILQATRDALTEAACRDVEVIGWLYQFYISERKDEVIGSKSKIAAKDIPAATQLFTPHWIVRYLVENSLGRLWLLNRPHSRLAERMDYYVAPDEKSDFSEKSDFLRVNSPEELRLCDPAVGSGHILTYAFDLLYAIYEEEGYAASDIPRLILEKNLVGLEIDGRAAALAAFALAMKARAKDRRFFRRADMPQPRITLLQPLAIDRQALAKADWYKTLGGNLLEMPVQEALAHDLGMLRQVDNIGSLLRPQLTVEQIALLCSRIETGSDLFSHALNAQVLRALDMLEPLAQRYHIVVANPPYMGGRTQNAKLKKFLKDEYADVKSDTFSAFIVRNLELAKRGGQLGFMSPFVWMFISSYEKLRSFLIENKTITSLVQLEYSGFEGATVPICTFTLENAHHPDLKGGYVRLSDFRGADNQASKTLEAIRNPACGWFFRASASDFKKIPGSPIAYWVSDSVRGNFVSKPLLSEYAFSDGKNITGNNQKYQRFFWEVSEKSVGSGAKWLFISKGGGFLRWEDTRDMVIDWSSTARDHYRSDKIGRLIPEYLWQRQGITWGLITSALPSFRMLTESSIFSDVGMFFHEAERIDQVLGILNSKVTTYLLELLNPTLNFPMEVILRLPIAEMDSPPTFRGAVRKMRELSRGVQVSNETDWDFFDIQLLGLELSGQSIPARYCIVRKKGDYDTECLRNLENESNRQIIEAYGLSEEIDPRVPMTEVSLLCNPHYRYGSAAIDEKQLQKLRRRWPQVVAMWPEEDIGIEQRLLADTMREFISYAVGCMFGRYSLDKPGLILANQGEGVADYVRLVGSGQLSVVGEDDLTTDNPQLITFAPDADNVIPLLDGDWFEDDIAERFKRFLRITFGDDNYADNLAFIEMAIGRDIRGYFLRDFYDFHVKMYKKRPIYWLFSSPKKHFNALIYMHRYRPDTASTVLEYLRDFRSKLQARRAHLDTVGISASATQSDKTRAIKEIAAIDKALADVNSYERDTLYPLATKQIDIDLDDGVLVNYNRFGTALKKITGITGKPIPDWAKPGNRV